jgi:hypothetical protein
MLEEWMEDRRIRQLPESMKATHADDSIKSGSVAEIQAHMEWLAAEVQLAESLEERTALYASIGIDSAILDRIRHRVFSCLCAWEQQLTFGALNVSIFERHRKRVDSLLRLIAPEVLEQFNAAYHRAQEGNTESLSHALTSCRRILKAVADEVCPAQSDSVLGDDGKEHKLGEAQYLNRLRTFMKESTKRSTAARLVHVDMKDFGLRIEVLNDLASKGVHDQVSQEEVNLCVIHTYLFAGEVLELAAGSPGDDSKDA